MTYTDEKSGLEVMTLSECVHTLQMTEVGRVAFQVDGQVHLYPVNYAWDGESVVFRTEQGSSLAQAIGTELVFEIDDVDTRNRSGWSVVIRGIPKVVSPADEKTLAERLQRLALFPWAPGEKDIWLRLLPSPMTGRRIRNDKY